MKIGLPLWYYRKKGVMLQEYFFREALKEIGINCGSITINHHDGRCHHSKTGWVPLIFPNRLLTLVSNINKTKMSDYYFKGVITHTRSWVTKYPGVYESSSGRNKSTKYMLDFEYYRMLSSARFALCPTGDCPWSYRFFEAIMCKSIPVIGDDERDIYSDGFFYYRDSDSKSYDAGISEKNFSILVKKHTLINFSTIQIK